MAINTPSILKKIAPFILWAGLAGTLPAQNLLDNTRSETQDTVSKSNERVNILDKKFSEILALAQQLIDDEGTTRAVSDGKRKIKFGIYTDSSNVSIRIKNETSQSGSENIFSIETSKYKISSNGQTTFVSERLLGAEEIPASEFCLDPKVAKTLEVLRSEKRYINEKDPKATDTVLNEILFTLQQVSTNEKMPFNEIKGYGGFHSDKMQEKIVNLGKWQEIQD